MFVEEVYRAAMGSAGQYDAACNLFWVNFRWSSAPKVPINRDAVKRLQAKLYPADAKPTLFDRATVIAVDESYQVARGNLRRVSPEEPEHAFLFALRDRIAAGADDEMLLHLCITTFYVVAESQLAGNSVVLQRCGQLAG